MPQKRAHFVPAAPLAEVQEAGCKVVHLKGHTVALFHHQGEVYAVDNRCPHMGFPLDRGTLDDGILTCHWHHARFDLETGGTFDQFADDARTFPVEVRDGEVWVDVALHEDVREHQRQRLQVGLERNIRLVIAKAVLVLLENGKGEGDAVEPFRIGLDFGARYRRAGWGQGLTILTCMMNLVPYLDPADRPRALYHGLAAVASESAGQPPRFPIRPLPNGDTAGIPTLKRWFRQFIAVRDAEGAERCIISAIRAGADSRQMADMMFSAITDYRYVATGHPADFTNKAFEALDVTGWEMAEQVLPSLVRDYADGARMEESNSWRHPVDLVAILDEAFERLRALDVALTSGDALWPGRDDLIPILHGDEPQAIADALLDALAEGCSAVELASIVSYAAALRIARFHTSNEFPDWDTALHTFTFANAIEQGLRRAPSVDLLRGVLDAAMSVYLDRFLNIPPARLPQPNGREEAPDAILKELRPLLDRQQQVDAAGGRVAHYLYDGGDPDPLLATLGHLLLREDRDFHTIQTVEAAFRQFRTQPDGEAGVYSLVAAGRYLAAHAPTVRSQGQTYSIAARLHRGEKIFEEG
ncbi:MAG: Rieske (2Fe-2S) protein [Candidatus Promineifilaceae bacterium]|nr:Rieske (2Fe-2S) protein [Candidatus Promineifilaceae bacterium]